MFVGKLTNSEQPVVLGEGTPVRFYQERELDLTKAEPVIKTHGTIGAGFEAMRYAWSKLMHEFAVGEPGG